MNVLEDSNNDSLTLYQGHNRNYGFTATLNPGERIGSDLAYNYNDFMQMRLICFNDTAMGVALPVVANAGSCAANDPANPLSRLLLDQRCARRDGRGYGKPRQAGEGARRLQHYERGWQRSPV